MTLRSPDQLATSLADVVDEQSHAPDSEFYRGCAAALEWVTGQRRTSPVDVDAAMAADEQAMNAELVAAIEMLHGERAIPRPLTRAYLSGVEGTLAWVLCQTDEAPL